MKGWLLDTNVVAEIVGRRPDTHVSEWIRSQEESSLFLSILTIAEYEKGIHNLPVGDMRVSQIRSALIELEFRFSGRILSLANATVRRWGTLTGQIKRISRRSPHVIDTLLAATAIEHDLYFTTRNTQDVALTGAMLFNPWKDDPAQFSIRH